MNDGTKQKLAEQGIRRIAEVEEATRAVVVPLITNLIKIHALALDPRITLAAGISLNHLANFTHTLGIVPRDVVQMAVDRCSQEAGEAGEVITQETNRRTKAKVRAVMRGESVPRHEDDGIFIGYDSDERTGF